MYAKVAAIHQVAHKPLTNPVKKPATITWRVFYFTMGLNFKVNISDEC